MCLLKEPWLLLRNTVSLTARQVWITPRVKHLKGMLPFPIEQTEHCLSYTNPASWVGLWLSDTAIP